jgi:hypothetical protein
MPRNCEGRWPKVVPYIVRAIEPLLRGFAPHIQVLAEGRRRDHPLPLA